LRDFALTPGDLWGAAFSKALIVYLLMAEGHGCVTFVIFWDAQPSLYVSVLVDRAYKVSIEAASKPKGMGHQ
jgi:hypothetical protein